MPNNHKSTGFKAKLAILATIIAILGGLLTMAVNWKALFPSKPGREAGITVMVRPSKVTMTPNSHATVTWTLAETNNVGVNIESRTGEWKTTTDRTVKTVGPIITRWRIEPLQRHKWSDDIYLYEDAANEATDGILILDQGFKGFDDNGNSVIGKARVRVTLTEAQIKQ